MRLIAGLFLATACLALAEDAPTSASFKEGVGILLGDESKRALALEIAEVEERAVPADVRITAQVYREVREASQNEGEPSGYAYASAWIEPSVVSLLPAGTELAVVGHPGATGTVLRTDHTAASIGGRLELLVQLRDPSHGWALGEFAVVTPRRNGGAIATVVPRSAVLDTAFGPFVYVANGHAFLRVPVVTGARHEEVIEIADGLYAGDVVVVRPVESLYLIELRATKGGGHSH